jgi:AraC-like DNA-binding protein
MTAAPSRTSTSPDRTLTVGAFFVKNMLSGLTSRGVDCSDFLADSGIDAALLGREDARVSLRQLGLLLRTVIERRDDEMIGFMTRASKRGSFALQARAAVAAPFLERAIGHVAHVFRLLQDDVSMERVREDGLEGIAFHFQNSAMAVDACLHELLLRVYWRLFAWLVGGRLPPVRFDFAYPRPQYADGYGAIFPAPWRFEAGHSAIWFQAEQMQLPVCRDTAALNAFIADGPVHVMLPSLDSGFAGRVRVHLQRTQPAWPTLTETATALHTSSSSLQRHLADEGISYSELKDQLRRDIAVFRLRTSDVPLAKLAAELGFADATSFQRAFKAWTGLPPGACRR